MLSAVNDVCRCRPRILHDLSMLTKFYANQILPSTNCLQEEKILNDMLNDEAGAYKRSLEGRIEHVTDLQYGQHKNIFATSYSSIHKAASDGNATGVHFFLGKKEKPRVYADDYDKFGIAAIHYAAEKGYDSIIGILLSAGCPVDCPTVDGMTALMYAAKNNQLATMEDLVVNRGANIMAVNRAGMSAAHFAAQLDHLETFEMLLKLNVIAKDRCMQEIADAEMLAENPDAVAADADKAARKAKKEEKNTEGSGKAPAHNDDDSTVASDAKPKKSKKRDSKTDKNGGAPTGAPKSGKVAPPGGEGGAAEADEDPVEALRKKYAPLLSLPDTAIVDIASKNGTRPIHIAATYNSLQVLELLIRVGALLNEADSSGENSLHKAARRCNTDAYKMLVAAGGYAHVKNTSRETPEELLKDNSMM